MSANKTFEYKVARVTISSDYLLEELNFNGEKGWELVNVLDGRGTGSSQHVCIFKRVVKH